MMENPPVLNIQDVKLPLDRFVEEIATKSAWVVIDKHINSCPIKRLAEDGASRETRLRNLENRFNVLLGAIVGAGALAGAVGAAVQKLLGG